MILLNHHSPNLIAIDWRAESCKISKDHLLLCAKLNPITIGAARAILPDDKATRCFFLPVA